MAGNELDTNAAMDKLRSDFLAATSRLAADSYQRLRGYDVLAHRAAVGMLTSEIPPQLLSDAAQVLAFTLEQVRSAEDLQGGIDHQTAQDRVDALTRVILREQMDARIN